MANIEVARSALHHPLPPKLASPMLVGAMSGVSIGMASGEFDSGMHGIGDSIRVRIALRWLLALFYLIAGTFHLLDPRPFVSITPQWVPMPDAVVLLTGLAELAAAPALLQPWSKPLRRAAGIGLALYAVCVYPANVNHMLIDLAKPSQGLGLSYHVPRLLAQPLLVWLALWVGEVTNWPWRKAPPR